MPTPQEKIDAIQAKVNEQNRQKALQNVANVQSQTITNNMARSEQGYKKYLDPAQNPNFNKVRTDSQGITPLPNAYNPATATAGQQVAAQNLTNKGIDPTKVGT